MNPTLRRAVALGALPIALALSCSVSDAAEAATAAALPSCPTVGATLNATMNSATANVGDVFTFTSAAEAGGAAGVVPAGLTGYGIVSYARHARRGQGGELELEPRFIVNADGSKTPVSGYSEYAVAKGSNHDAPGVLSAVGAFHGTAAAVASGALGFYGFVHYGGEAVVRQGAPMRLIVGDGIYDGTCSGAALIEHPNYGRR